MCIETGVEARRLRAALAPAEPSFVRRVARGMHPPIPLCTPQASATQAHYKMVQPLLFLALPAAAGRGLSTALEKISLISNTT